MKRKVNSLKEKIFFTIIITIIYYLLLYFLYCITLPAISFNSGGFYFFIILIFGYLIGLFFYYMQPFIVKKSLSQNKTFTIKKNNQSVIVDANIKFSSKKLFCYGFVGFCFVVFIFTLIGQLVGIPLFRAKDYYKQLTITQGTNEDFCETFSYGSGNVELPIIDKELSFKLAQSKLSSYGAQYQISTENFSLTSINKDGVDQLVRVCPLEYSNTFVAIGRKNKGTIGYIIVNVVTKEAELVNVENSNSKGLVYMPSAIFSKDLTRHLRFNYPNELFGHKNFEIDDSGNPYWVIPTYKNKIGLFNGSDSSGVILCDPISGKTQKYNIGEEPEWVDRVIDDRLVEKQGSNALTYKNGFFNATIGQKKEVLQLSDGYNYFLKDGHSYYVSCITSPNEQDQTSVGFIAIDLKTRLAIRYNIDGITEMRARQIAMNDERVKAQQLDSTWPILINFENVPTYFIVLKNEVQDQKIVLINVDDGSKVSMGNTISQAKSEYQTKLADDVDSEINEVSFIGTVDRIKERGDNIEFILSTNSEKYFIVKIDLNLDSRFLQQSDNVEIKAIEYKNYYYVTFLKINS